MSTETDPQQRRAWRWVPILGGLLIAAGLLFNKWSVERLFVPDEYLEGAEKVAVIVALQAVCVCIGLWLLLGRPGKLVPAGLARLMSILVLIALGVGAYGNLRALKIIDPRRERAQIWERVVASEELLLSLSPLLSNLGDSVMNLSLPDAKSHPLFADRLSWTDLAAEGEPLLKPQPEGRSVAVRSWPVEEVEVSEPAEQAMMWERLLNEVSYFEHAKFYFVKGRFLDDSRSEYETEIGFKGLAWMKAGAWSYITTSQVAVWGREAPSEKDAEPAWRIHDWRLLHAETLEADRTFFAEVLNDSVVEFSDLKRARRSIHEETIVDTYVGLEEGQAPEPPHEFFTPASWDRHPGTSVVDLDRDGFDDVYVMARWGKNLALRNRGDGTFEEVAERFGLDIENHTSSAVFADFDNDGDADAFLGRTLGPSVYLANEDGRFVDRSELAIDGTLPQLVSSTVATDFDGDGLLDVYFSTYAAGMILKGLEKPERLERMLEFLPEADAASLRQQLREQESHKFLNQPGPPNVLLKNLGGGRFEVLKEPSALRLFRNTYQATWADVDGDGDQDVYVANDFSPNNLILNEGDGRFVDVTEQTGTADIGFGMGVSWGDYDNDGHQDLYISNMFSKAGQRITAQLPDLDPRFALMAHGNSLFRNRAEGLGFEKVSGQKEPALTVEKAGWSWGSQFVDFDNDGFLDTYALSGFYTEPWKTGLPDG